ncbi:UDP-glucose 4-epimerase family protein [Marinobacter vinifirmus]|uniref:UDP-glucose 4-epimerase family protein n=1 Tax=Marinobacter vinifirmus TaxID=355591 RepID=UPI003B5A546D
MLLTGATGFVGSRVAERLSADSGLEVTCAVRRPGLITCTREVQVGDLGPSTDWLPAVDGQDVVIHTAARAHVMKDEATDPVEEYRRVNVEGTLSLALQAAAAGVRRFIFVSSIKVNGEQTPINEPFTENDAAGPVDAYGISKMEAEEGLQEIAEKTGMELVIIRPPLVYGPGVKGNFANMIKIVERGWPLPLGAVNNKRSMVALDNLVSLISVCVDHPAAANQVFLAGDGEDVSTAELLRGIGRAMGKPIRLIPVPAQLLILAASIIGKKSIALRVLGSLQVDIAKARALLDWEPPLSMDEGLRRCFLSENKV